MDKKIMQKLLFAQASSGRDVCISVTGTSMNPTLLEGDTITIRKFDTYDVGDILVYVYKGELLVHRLLKIQRERFFCKGDNSFRLEDLPYEDIVGKVILRNDREIPPCSSWLIPLSYQVNRTFRKCGYNTEMTKKSGIYRFYYNYLWKVEENIMIYKKNDSMDYIYADETSLAVFDPESGDTHFFDETGIDILNCLSAPCDLDTLVERLCKIYDAEPDVIKNDLIDFLAELVAKKVVIAE